MNYDFDQEFQCYAAAYSIAQTLTEIDGIMAADLATTVRTVSTGIDTLKKLAGIAVKSQNVELQEGLLQLREELLTVKENLLDVREENLQLKEENQKLAKALETASNAVEEMIVRDGLYYKADSDDGPFCTGCYDRDRKAIRLKKMTGHFKTFGSYQCPSCKNPY